MTDLSANTPPSPTNPFADGTATPEVIEGFPQVTCVLRNWATLKGDRLAPRRSEIDPRPIASALSQTFIAALVAPRVARMRIAGTGLHDLMGMDVRGMPLTVFFNGHAREEVMRACTHVTQGGHVLLPVCTEKAVGQPPMDGLLALLPLSSDGSRIDLVLGILETSGQIGTAPRRFQLRSPLRAPKATALPRTRPLIPALRDQMTGPASAETPLSGAAAAGRRAAFRVIPGGRSD
ncbi:PAS domain-containing protein [Rhodobacteraceae bacterium 2376]|uniref:PAS domain-containing protein n=1 Tax=Rhabdonatronobacter sediminivivens TaxID=2743469 RepID=A0A7Z0I1H2_9RHOB|nr:PAS domain-containing protein [Rhabdonatronobacter sediminivivens]NYS26184.1 PAS domain-containing protein [Rhabdonatronobacter sediminivivens]